MQGKKAYQQKRFTSFQLSSCEGQCFPGDSLVDKQIIEEGEHYVSELRHDAYGGIIEQHHSVIKDDRDTNTTTKSTSISTRPHHSWKQREYKDMPKGPCTQEPSGAEEQRLHPSFVCHHTQYCTIHADARVWVKPGKPRQLNYSMYTAVDISPLACDHPCGGALC
jgi:hypothetical protein